MLCGTSKNGIGVCFGDSRGPPIAQRSDGQVVVSVISQLTIINGGCAAKNKPAIFTRVSSYLDWIHDTIPSNMQ